MMLLDAACMRIRGSNHEYLVGWPLDDEAEKVYAIHDQIIEIKLIGQGLLLFPQEMKFSQNEV